MLASGMHLMQYVTLLPFWEKYFMCKENHHAED